MKGKIDSQGVLCIWRDAAGFRQQECRFSTSACTKCDHNCSMFGEPEGQPRDRVALSLCKRTLFFAELIDERTAAEG